MDESAAVDEDVKEEGPGALSRGMSFSTRKPESSCVARDGNYGIGANLNSDAALHPDKSTRAKPSSRKNSSARSQL